MAADLVSAMLLGGAPIVHLGRPSDEPEIFTAACAGVHPWGGTA
jgi:hypothetical protein